MYEAILPGLHEIAIGHRASTRFKFQLTEIGTGATFFWTAEEFGLLGSSYYVNSLNETELAKIKG